MKKLPLAAVSLVGVSIMLFAGCAKRPVTICESIDCDWQLTGVKKVYLGESTTTVTGYIRPVSAEWTFPVVFRVLVIDQRDKIVDSQDFVVQSWKDIQGYSQWHRTWGDSMATSHGRLDGSHEFKVFARVNISEIASYEIILVRGSPIQWWDEE